MAYPVTIGGNTFVEADFTGFNYNKNWERYLSSLELVLTSAQTAEQAAAAAAAALAAALLITGGSQGVGEGPLDLPRNTDLGEAAFADWAVINGIFVKSLTGAYTINSTDYTKLLVAASGTLTFSLPLAADVPAGFNCRIKNRSGSNLTLARAGSDKINGAGSNLTVSTATQVTLIRSGTASWETA